MERGSLGRVVVAGGTGLVGRPLVAKLLDLGADVSVLSREPDRAELPEGAEARGYEDLAAALEGSDAVINLAGASIGGRRWNEAYKRELVASRVGTAMRIVEAIGQCRNRPKALVNASAVGYYGPQDGRPITEADLPGRSFLAGLCAAWEQAAAGATAFGVRVVQVRSGVALARKGGALARMALPMKLFQGTALGSGQQGFSWIHMEDLVDLYLEAAANPAWSGPFNGTAPRPTSNETFTRYLGKQLRRPVLPVPGLLTELGVELLLGELSTEILQGAFVYPRKAQALGFRFRFEKAEDALADLLG